MDVSTESIALMTVKVANDHVPGHQPRITQAYLGPSEAKARKLRFKTHSPEVSEDRQYNLHLVSLSLPPGEYWIDTYTGMRHIPMVLAAQCNLPVEQRFTVQANEIVYLGRVEGHIRKKNKGERAAGPVVPLIDQALAGFSTGTFDVTIEDRYDEDMAMFLARYPALEGETIKKRPLDAQQ